MKKLSCLIALSFLVVIVSAQKIKFQKITFGAVVLVSGTLTFASPLKPFVLGSNLLVNVVFVTKKTYHNFLYGLGNNVIRTIQGYKPRKNMGIYLALQKNLSKSGGYTGVGIEKFIPINESVTTFLFCEIGKNFGDVKSEVLVIGVHTNIQSLLWERPKK